MSELIDPQRVRSLSAEEEQRLLVGVKRDRRWRAVLRRWFPTAMTVAIGPLLLGVWLLFRQLDLIHPILLPEVMDVVHAIGEVVPANGFAGHVYRTLTEIALGFLLG